MGTQRRGLRAVPPDLAGGQGQRAAALPARAERCRGAAEAVPADPEGLARQRHEPGVGRPRGAVRRSAVLGERHPPDRPLRRADPPLPGALGALRPRSGAGGGRRGHGRLPRRPDLAAGGRGVPARVRALPRLPRAAGDGPRLPDPGGLRRAELGADRQPPAGHREGAPLPRGLRSHGPASAGRGGRAPEADHRASLELFQSDIAPVLRRAIPDPVFPDPALPDL